MPASGAIKLADANIWLALAFSDQLHHTKAKNWFDAQSDGSCVFCRVTQMALLRHLTNSSIMGRFTQTQQEAWNNYDMLAKDPRAVFFSEPPALESAFRDLTQGTSPLHRVWTDAYLAAFAMATQSQLVTCDQAFGRFAGLNLLVLVSD